MYVITGASGQVGSSVVKHLLKQNKKVKAIIHDKKKATQLKGTDAAIVVADAYDLLSIKAALKDGDVLFAITPETGHSTDLIAETQTMVNNYHDAVAASSIKKVVGLSSLGAHLGKGTGNLEMSYLLERAFDDLPVTRVFIRPAYYFSNWLMNMEQVRTEGILPTFFPVDLSIPMISPQDVAKTAAYIMVKDDEEKVIYELEGPYSYTSADVAQAFARALGKPVKAQQIPHEEWGATLQKVGFSDDGISNFIKMTELVVKKQTDPEGHGATRLKGDTTLDQFIKNSVNH